MKLAVLFYLSASASPLPVLPREVGVTANEFVEGGCRDIILIHARGSLQAGNMGSYPGPRLANLLKARYGDDRVAAQGVDYPASLLANFEPDGTDSTGIEEIQALITDAASNCTASKIVMSGFSQGAAVIHAAGKYLPAPILSRVNVAVTFVDTRNEEDGGRIPNFPPEKTLIICNDGDDVCEGDLDITPAHRDYDRRAPEAAAFIFKQLA